MRRVRRRVRVPKGEGTSPQAKVSVTPDVETQGFVPAENLTAVLGNYAETAESSEVREQAEEELGRATRRRHQRTNRGGDGDPRDQRSRG